MGEDMELRSEYPDVHIPDNITIGQLLLDRCRLHGDAVALVSALGTRNRHDADFGVSVGTAVVVMTTGAASDDKVLDFHNDSHWCR